MLIERSVRPKKKRKLMYSHSALEAAQIVGIDNEKVYRLINAGLLFTTSPLTPYSGQRVSDNELIEFARYMGIELWNTKPVPKAMWVLPWRPSKKADDCYRGHLYEFIKIYTGYDGSIYTGLINDEDYPVLDFVCSNLFRYNQMQMRHRPYASQRHVYLCWKTEAEEENCLRLQKEMNKKYASEIIRVCELER